MKTRKVHVQITEPDGSVIFEKKNVEVPKDWSDRAATIAASKYFSHSEDSVLTVVGRIARQIKLWGQEQGYFQDEMEADLFMTELEEAMLDQRFAFNSPVWFNIGVAENDNQVAACFIYGVDDNMDDILAHAKREGMTFKNGSGAGVNVSKLRAKGELLSNRGVASGPVSFMRIWDQTAASIKSGGKTRRSAKMVVMDVDHPDIEEFIKCKSYEERKALTLMESGISMEEAYNTVAFQNANHSVMMTDRFIKAVREDGDWDLINRGDGKVAKTVRARDLFYQIAEIAWETGDPGVQFYNRINKDNPVPTLGNIECSNPCAEHVAVNNSACNLSSLNLLKYMDDDDGSFDEKLFSKDVGLLVLAQDIMINKADYPTPETKDIAMETRPLGIGFTNLGATLMLKGLPYESHEGRLFAAKVSKMMTKAAYLKSAELAHTMGPFGYYDDDEENARATVETALRLTEDDDEVRDAVTTFGVRNSQLTLLAPTGTISFLMDCDTTGIEPLFALKTYKQLAGGGVLEIVPECVNDALMEQTTWDKYDDNCPAADKFIQTLPSEMTKVFKTAGEITPHDHLMMMAACQKHLNGAISKTVNMPHKASVEDVAEVYMTAWEQGLKSVAIYRDGSKQLQPLTAVKDGEPETVEVIESEDDADKWAALRRKLPATRQSITHKFDVAGLKGYLTCSMYEEGEIGEIFIRTQKQGTTVQGLMDGFATAVSLALQYGVPLETFTDKFIGSKFEPAGFTTDEDIRMTTSVLDYIFRWLKLQFMDDDDDEIFINETQATNTNVVRARIAFDGPPCPKCQTITGRNGTCYVCPQCGETTGCS